MSLKIKLFSFISTLLLVVCTHSAVNADDSDDDSAISVRRGRVLERRRAISPLESAALRNASHFKTQWTAQIEAAKGYLARRRALISVLAQAQEELISITHNQGDAPPPSPADNWAPQSEADAFARVSLHQAEFDAALEAADAAASAAAHAEDLILRLMDGLRADFENVREFQFHAWMETTLSTLWTKLYEASHARLKWEEHARRYHQALVLDPAGDDAIFDQAPPPFLNVIPPNDVFDPDLLPR
jgi:hypothetical protein